MRHYICQFLIIFVCFLTMLACEPTQKPDKVDTISPGSPLAKESIPEKINCHCELINGICPCNMPVHLGLEVDHGSGGLKSLRSSSPHTQSPSDTCYTPSNGLLTIYLEGSLLTLCNSKSKMSILVRLLQNDTVIAPNSISYDKSIQFSNNPINNSRMFFSESDFIDELSYLVDTCGAPFINEVVFNPVKNNNGVYNDYKIHFEILNHVNHTHSTSVLANTTPQARQIIGPDVDKEKAPLPIDTSHQHIYEFYISICN